VKTIFGLLSFLILAMMAARSDASPVVVYNNFGAGESYNTTNAWTVEGTSTFFGQSELAESFTPTSTVTLDAVLLPLERISGTNSLIVSLRPDASGQPGTTSLESFTLTTLPTLPTSSVFQLNSLANPVLDAGVTYWITLFPGAANTEVGWMFNSTGADHYSSSSNGGATWQANLFNPAPAMEILGDPVPTPEPSTISMLAGLGACTVVWSWKRRRTIAQ